MNENVAVLVPRRADGGHRDRVWAWVKANRWDGWRVYEGTHEGGPFNRSAAINDAARQAGQWDIGIIADSDSFAAAEQLEKAIAGCQADGRMWLPYDRFWYLTEAMSAAILNGLEGGWKRGIEFSMQDTCSSLVVVTRYVWDLCGGFDEGFESWGMEDVAFSHAAQTYGGGIRRVPGPVWHLWHPPSTEGRATSWDEKVARAQRYQAAAYDRRAMTALLDELHVRR